MTALLSFSNRNKKNVSELSIMEDHDLAARDEKFWSIWPENHESNELRTYWKQFKYLQEKRARTLSSSQRQNIYISLELKLPESLGGKWKEVHHLQRRGCGSETKRNPVIKLELLEVVPQTSDAPQGAFGRDHLLPSLCAWASHSSDPWVPDGPPPVALFPYPCPWESKGAAPGRRIFPTIPGSLCAYTPLDQIPPRGFCPSFCPSWPGFFP